MAKGFYDFLFEFSSALGADEVSRFVDRFRRRGTSGTAPTQGPRSAAQTGGDVDDAYYDLKKAGAPSAKQQTVWAWIQNLKRTQDGRAALKRLERDKNTARIKNMFEQGTEDEWRESIPQSWRQRADELLPTLDAATQEQMRKTLGAAVRRQERRAATLNSPKRFWVGLVIYVVGVLFTLVILFPNWVLFVRHIFVNLFR